ncbi:transglutaminase domain-containing protein [Patiriisocius hiemis]|uniref:Transglutaminase domain-containing protein n=1 Tax=Patiriisocius hiemis TaxID=3075604 RepID=A0ABU2YA62_9FLAO|nr:transglutaminase domain-containing protein [Constantimarinum sp. W242]MDT0555080.1 transglutaminase domain-containing protein [Constantimarinum sp. W242]
MNKLFFYLALVTVSISGAQDYQKVDAIVLQYPSKFSSTEKLSEKIATNFSTEEDRVRAIYVWITNNIAYSFSERNRISNSIRFSTEAERLQKLRERQKLQAERTLSTNAAICHGYSTLFKELCDQLGIQSSIISGYSRNSIEEIGKKNDNSNHAWNKVTINGVQYLVDTTWGAGSFSSREFIKDPTDFYYKTPPEVLINIHHPQKKEDALLSDMMSRRDYEVSVLQFGSEAPNHIIISPKNGILSSKDNKETRFTFNSKEPIDWIGYSLNNDAKTVKDISISDNKVSFAINLYQQANKELIIFINGKAVCGYIVK